jgi:hypothetical protein
MLYYSTKFQEETHEKLLVDYGNGHPNGLGWLGALRLGCEDRP